MSGAAFQRSVLRGPVVMCQTELPSSPLVSPRLVIPAGANNNKTNVKVSLWSVWFVPSGLL